MVSARLHTALTLLLALPLLGETPSPTEGKVLIGEQEYLLGQECRDGEYNLRFEFAEANTKPIEVLFGYRDAGNHYRLSVSPEGTALFRVLAGRSNALTKAAASKSSRLAIQRRRQRLTVTFDQERVLSAEDDRFHAGSVALAVGPEFREVRKFRYQPVSAIYFTDDFMRAGQQESVWTPVVGQWKVTTTIDHASGGSVFNPVNWERSANPFVFEGAGENGALAVTGQDFWDEYRFGVSLRGRGPVGCVFLYRDTRHYYGIRWDLASVFPRACPFELYVQRGEEREVLTRVGVVGKANQWYRVEAQAGPDGIRVWLDGAPLLSTMHEPLYSGKVGLRIEEGGQALFDDVVVETPTGRGQTGDVERTVSNRIFGQDIYMLDWSAPQGAWVPGPGPEGLRTYWHKGDFYGRFDLRFPLGPGGIRRVAFLAEGADWGSGYELSLVPSNSGQAFQARLRRKQKEVASARIEAPQELPEFRLSREGKSIICRVDGKDVLTHRDDDPPSGSRLSLAFASGPRFADVKLSRDHVIDDLFTRAPTRWDAVGRWEVTDKFICDPRWSYLAGESDGLAATWHKDAFTGDLTLEYYAGMRFREELRRMPHYPRPGDMNAVICGDGANVFSGYTFVLAGWHTTWTRILKNGKVVAESRKPLVPDTRYKYPPLPYLHRRWFYVKARKRGNRLEFYLDNKLALTYEDPEPLVGGRVGLWTQDNSIMVARVKIEYEEKEPHRPIVREIPASRPDSSAVSPHVVIDSGTHPGSLSTFDQGLDGWHNPSGDQGAVLRSVPRKPGRGNCLELVNANSGGDFAARAPITELDLSKEADLRFDCRIGPGVKANLYLNIFGKRHFVHVTGPAESNENLKRLGSIEGVTADDRWHKVTFPLGAAVRALYPAKSAIPVTRLVLGSLHKGYLLAGHGGNRAGVRYWIDNFRISSVGDGNLEADFSVPGTEGAKFSAVVSKRARPRRQGQQLADAAALEEGGLKDGRWNLHVRARLPDGNWTAASTLPFRVNGRAASISRVRPTAASEWGGREVAAELSSGRAPRSLALTVAGQTFGPETDAVSMDWEARRLTFDVARTGLVFADGQKVPLKLTLDGTEKEWSYTWRFRDDQTPPGPVVLDQLLMNDTFEKDIGKWQSFRGELGALLVRSEESPASGRYSLKLFNESIGGHFGALARSEPFSAGQYPLLRFKYRIPHNVLIDLGLSTPGGWKRVVLNDNDHRNYQPRLGRVPGATADGQWHQAEVNLQEMLRTQPFNADQFVVSQLAFGDWGWQGNREGDTYWIDDLRITPILNPGKGIKLSWRAEDNSGIRAYSYHWSESPDEPADEEPEGDAASAEFRKVPDGAAWFHIRAQDNAGNWGPSTGYKFIVDRAPPKVVRIEPRPGSKSGDGGMEIELHPGGPSGIDPSSLTLTLNGVELKPGQGGLQYEPARQRLVWEWLKGRTDDEKAIPNGKKFQVALSPFSDFAGNQSKAANWEWTMDHARDKSPPPAPAIQAPPEVALCHQGFSRGIGGCAPYGGGMRVTREMDELSRDACLQVTQGMDATYCSAYLWRKPYDLAKYPYVSFDYRFREGLKLDLMAQVNGAAAVVKLTDADVRRHYTTIGDVRGVSRDDQWHHLSLNLLEMAKESLPKAESWKVTYVAIGRWSWSGWNPIGTTYRIDNFTISAPAAVPFAAKLDSVDVTGIRGYSFLLDQNPLGAPPEKVNASEKPIRVTPPKRGTWYLHARACDGAGNWSPAAHLSLFRP